MPSAEWPVGAFGSGGQNIPRGLPLRPSGGRGGHFQPFEHDLASFSLAVLNLLTATFNHTVAGGDWPNDSGTHPEPVEGLALARMAGYKPP